MFRPLHWPASEFLATLPEALAAELATAVGEPFRVEGRWRGGTANCYLLVLDSGRKLVFKHPRDGRSLEPEIALLRRGDALGLVQSGLLPQLAAVFGDGAGHLAAYVPGKTVLEELRSGNAGSRARQLAEGLHTYHGLIGEPVGDFHLANVVVHERGVTFLDPGSHYARPLSADEPFVVRDLADWFGLMCGWFPLFSMKHPRSGWRWFEFNVELMACALESASDPDASSRAISEGAIRRMAVWMPTAKRRRDRVVYHPARLVARAIAYRARRRIKQRRALTPTPDTRD